jgi:hypothetical protein
MEPSQFGYLNEDALYQIIRFIVFDNDYSELFENKVFKRVIKKRYLEHQRLLFCDGILEFFSRLFYLHVIAGPPTRQEVDGIFIALDYTDLFQVPNYYDISIYMKMFKEYIEFVFDNNFYKSKSCHKKIFTRRRVSTVEALTLC